MAEPCRDRRCNCPAVGVVWRAPVEAASYTWTNTAAGTSADWTNSIFWGPNETAAPTNGDSAYLTNAISSGTYTTIFDYAPGIGTLAALVISNSGAGQAWLIVTNATLSASTLTLGNGGVLQIDNGGVVTNAAAANTNWWYGNNGTIYLDNGGKFFTTNAVTVPPATP